MYTQLKSKNTAPIATEIADQLVAGSNLVQESTFSTKIVEMLAISQDLRPLSRYFLTKSPSGIVSLHSMLPYYRISMRIGENNRPTLSRQIVFVAVNCNKNEYDTKDQGVHVISENNLAMSELSMDNNGTYNGVIVVGSPIENYIPYSRDVWLKEFKESTIGQVANDLTLKIYFDLQELAASLQNADEVRDPEDIRKEMAKKWDKYVKNEEALKERNVLVKSNLIYADSCAFAPITTAFQHTSSANPYLDAKHLYGSVEAGASYAPTISLVTASGIITPKETADVTGYKYGQYAVNSKRDEIIIVPKDAKATTLETTTREIVVHDGSGRTANLELTVNDITRNGNIIKRSSRLAEIPAGTPVKVNGKLSVRVKQEKCLAVQFRLSDVEWTTENRSSSSNVNADLTTSFDESEALFDEMLNSNVTALQDTPSVAANTDNLDLDIDDQPKADAQSETGGQAGF